MKNINNIIEDLTLTKILHSIKITHINRCEVKNNIVKIYNIVSLFFFLQCYVQCFNCYYGHHIFH